MTSINTNKAALLALSAVNSANTKLAAIQQRVSTGLAVSSAKDNGAVYAMAQGMRAVLSGHQAVTDSLARGQSAIDVAMAGAESINDLLVELKSHAVALNDPSDQDSRDTIRAAMEAILKQIDQISRTAEFDGVNLLTGRPLINTRTQATYTMTSTMTQPASFLNLPAALPPSASIATSKVQVDTVVTSPVFASAFAQISGAGSQTVSVDAGATGGRVNLMLDALGVPDVAEIWQSGVRVAATGQPYAANGVGVAPGVGVSGVNMLHFDYDPTKGQILEFRFNEGGAAPGTAWNVGGINLQDPADPVLTPTPNVTVSTVINSAAESQVAQPSVDPEDAVQASGLPPAANSGSFILPAGSQSGRVDLVFDAFDLPDTVEVHQAGAVIAASGQSYAPGGGTVAAGVPVSGQQMLSFDYDPSLGDITLVVNPGGADLDSAWAVAGMVLRPAGAPIAPPSTGSSSVQEPGFGIVHYDFLTDGDGESTIRASTRDMTPSGLGLGALDWNDPASVLAAVQSAQGVAIADAAYFGTTANAFQAASDYGVTKGSALEVGVGNLVDADLDREAAKLQAAQIQQQLAVQALGIANGGPNWLLKLFERG